MADPQIPLDDVAQLFAKLHPAQLVEFLRFTSLDGVRGTCHQEFHGRKLDSVIAELFPDFSPERVADVAAEITVNSVKNACWRAIMQMPGNFAVNLRCPDVAATEALRTRKGPAILAFWHYGPVTMLTYGFRKIGIEAPLTISRAPVSQWNNRPETNRQRLRVSESNPQQRMIALRRSLDQLKRGGNVSVALDGGLGKRDVAVPFLGRQYSLSRGAVGLARLTGAPIIPVTMQWDRGNWSMAIRVFDPVPLPDVPAGDIDAFEQALLANAVACFEAYGRENPGQFKVDQLATLMDSPRLTS